MTILPAGGDPPGGAALAAAVEALRSGQVVGMPTDTVYGLAVDPSRPGASDAIFVVKARPRHVRLPLLVAGIEQALEVVDRPGPAARRLMDQLWPGPLTIVLRRRPGLGLDIGDDPDETVGVRSPAHPVPVALCRAIGPLATTSANRHGDPSATTAREVARLGGVAVVLDAGRCDAMASTVVDCTTPVLRLVRQGAVTWDRVVAAAG